MSGDAVRTPDRRALAHLQSEENRPFVDEAMRRQTLVTGHEAWRSMLSPGATLLEPIALGPVALAP